MNKFAQGVIATVAVLFITSPANAASSDRVDLLQYIPADTPYVFASTEAMPDKVTAKFEPIIDEALQTYQRMLRQLMADKLVKMSAEEDSGGEAEQLRGVMEEVLGLMSIEGIRGAGIGRDSAFAIYGNGLLPVMRFELTDAALFDAAIERIENKAGAALAIGDAGRHTYRFAELDPMKVVIATIDGQAVITIVPLQFNEKQIAKALGLKGLRRNIGKNGNLQMIQEEYDFAGYMTGYIDVARIVQTLTGDASGLDKEFLAALNFKAPEMSDNCHSEVEQLAGIAPRIVFGYLGMTTEYLQSSTIIELRPDIAEGLATLPVPVAGLGVDPGGFMSFGFSMNPLMARNFYEARLNAMEEDPFECEFLAKIQGGVAKGREVLNAPIPPVFYSFRGFVGNITDFDPAEFNGSELPESLDATILFAFENAESLLMIAASMAPEVAALNLVADGKAVKLDLPQLASVAQDVYVALSADGIAMALGNDAEASAADALRVKTPDSPRFVSMHMDAARYYAMIGDTMLAEEPNAEGEKMPLAIREAMRDLMVLSGSMYERLTVDVRLTPRGIEMDAHVTLGD